MRRFIASLTLLIAYSGSASADPYPWRGGDIWLDARVGLWKSPRVEVETYGRYVVDPSAGDHELVGAFGLRLHLFRGLRTTVRFGAVQSWTAAGYAPAFLVGLSNRQAFLHERILLTDDEEYSVDGNGHGRFRGRYGFDAAFVELLTTQDAAWAAKNLDDALTMSKDDIAEKVSPLLMTVGLQCDQRDTLVACGPHFGMRRPRGVWNAQLQYFLGFQDGNRGHSLRLYVGLDW